MKLNLTVSKIAQITHAELVSSHPQLKVTSFVTDSRVIRPGDAFIALKGKNHDARQFIPQALQKGALVILAEKGFPIPKDTEASFILVDDSLKALQALAESIGLLHGVSIETDADIQYRNMAKANSQRPEALEAVYKAAEKLSIKLEETLIRGGTDGAALAYNGIASPNIFTGAHNMHSLTEWVALEAMERGTELMLAIIEEMVR